jgi:transposase
VARAKNEALRALTNDERWTLERVRRAGSERADHVRRATALAAVAEGQPFVAAARRAGLHSGSTVAGLVGRFNRHGLGALAIAAGCGRKPIDDATARAPIVATAQRQPDRKQDGTATWSLSTLEHSLRREALPAIGATSRRRVLQDAGSSYQKTRTWCPTGTAQRKPSGQPGWGMSRARRCRRCG